MHTSQQHTTEQGPDYWGIEALKEWWSGEAPQQQYSQHHPQHHPQHHLDRSTELGSFVSLPADEALGLLTVHLVGKGAIVLGQAGNTVTFSYKKDPNWLIFLFLLALGLLPGLLYGIAASGEVRFSITATPVPQEGGCRLLFGGEPASHAGYREFMRWVDKHQRR